MQKVQRFSLDGEANLSLTNQECRKPKDISLDKYKSAINISEMQKFHRFSLDEETNLQLTNR